MRFKEILECRCCRWMSEGKLFHAVGVGPATENARLPSWRLVRGTRRSPRAAERRAEHLATVVTGTHISFIYDGAGPFIALQTRRHSLKVIHSLARSYG